jgi:hypothetical protein
MLEKICENCNIKFILPSLAKKYVNRRFCGPICSRKWAADNRSDSWKEKASLAKQGKNNPMFGVSLKHPNSLANLARGYWKGKTQTVESNNKRSTSMSGRKVIWSEESKKRYVQKGIEAGRFWKPDDPEYLEFKKYRRKVYYWTSKNDLTQLEHHEKRGKLGYHLDHMYSITEGFKDNVAPKIIGSIYNLRFIDHKENCSKGTKCSITLEKLYELFTSAFRSL